MSRIIDYIYWRGDLSFKQEPFNAIDAAIFSQLSVLDFDDIVPEVGEGIPLWRLFELYIEKGYKVSDPVGLLISNKHHYLFQAVAKAPRYKDLLCSNYIRIYEENNPCQFEAMTFSFDNNVLISFGGTDDTILGWHEDFELLYLEEIPAHKYGKKYLEKIAGITDKEIILCGHSKGANIAMEVLLNTTDEIFDRIPKVYCFDGPGISQKEYHQAVIDGRIDKIISYVPYRASIGKLFNHYEEVKIVECTANLAFQHDLLTWHIFRNDFIYKEHLSSDSVYLDIHLKKIIHELSFEEKKTFVSALFNLFYATGAKTLLELANSKARFVNSFLKLPKDEKVILNNILVKKIMNDARMRKIFLSFVKEFNNRD